MAKPTKKGKTLGAKKLEKKVPLSSGKGFLPNSH